MSKVYKNIENDAYIYTHQISQLITWIDIQISDTRNREGTKSCKVLGKTEAVNVINKKQLTLNVKAHDEITSMFTI